MIPFNKPYIVGTEMLNIKEVINSHKLAGDYTYTKLGLSLIVFGIFISSRGL